MRALRTVCLPLLCIALASCGGSASKSSGMSLEEFAARLESMKTPFEEPCELCNGTGTVTDEAEGTQVQCSACRGKGKIKALRGPTQADFEAAVGKPDKTENKDLIWEYWYYRCKEGKLRLPAYLDEKRGDVVRVVTDKPELIE